MKNINQFTIILVFALLSVAVSHGRTWTQQATGKTIEADLVRVVQNNVVLRFRGREVTVPISSLSAEDQAFIAAQAAAMTSSGGGAKAGEWARFRGADFTNISPEKGLLKSWPSEGPRKLWTYEKAGKGYCSVITAEGKLYTLGSRDSQYFAVALDPESGRSLWETQLGRDSGGYGGQGEGPRATPTYHNGKLYIVDSDGGIYCLNAADGESVWTANMSDFSGQDGTWGFTESPLAIGDKIYLSPGGSRDSVVALDAATGRKAWGCDIDGAGTAEYTSMVLATIGGEKQIVKLFMNKLVGINLETGRLSWDADWRGATAVCATPVVADDKVYISTGYGVGCKLVTVQGRSARDSWDNKVMKNHHGGVVKVGDYIYGFSDGAGLICQSWETGDLVWNEKGRYTNKGSVCVADGMIYALSEDEGMLTLAEVTPEGFEKKGEVQIERLSGRKTWTHPVVIGGKLYLRDQDYLVCYDVKG